MISKNPVYLGYDDPVDLSFHEMLSNIEIKLWNAPSEKDLLNILPRAAVATWASSSDVVLSSLQEAKSLRNVFTGKTIPALKRFVNFIWSFEGIDAQMVSHILRYQAWDFIAQCSDTISWRDKAIAMPDAVAKSPEFRERFEEHVKAGFQLYADMADTREINLLDARHVLPRAATTLYWVHNDFQSTERFVNDRVSVEFQPQEDNVMSFQMALAIEKKYPLASGVFDLDRVDRFYGKMLEDHGRTFYPRDKALATISEDKLAQLDFAYDKTRDEYRGTEGKAPSAYEALKAKYIEELEEVRKHNNELVKERFGVSIEELDNLPAFVE